MEELALAKAFAAQKEIQWIVSSLWQRGDGNVIIGAVLILRIARAFSLLYLL
jgi:hypothetical protein